MNITDYLLLASAPSAPPAPSIGRLGIAGQFFTMDGQPWRYKGVSAFKLCRLFTDGADIDGFLSDYAGYNVLRVWDYTPVKDWAAAAWESNTPDEWIAFLAFVAARGWFVELTLLTDDDPARIGHAERLITALYEARIQGLLLEAGNEPLTHKTIDTHALKLALKTYGFPYCSGDYEDSDRWYGSYYTCHTARKSDWPRRAHDLREFYEGNGPDKPTEPHHVPCVADEPGKLQDVGTDAKEWRAYFGNCGLQGAGGLFHSETGKTGQRPTVDEQRLAAVALDALNAFPADAASGHYRRIVEPGNEPGGPTQDSRTYVVGNYAVRCQQAGTSFPEPGWTPLDPDGVLWRR